MPILEAWVVESHWVRKVFWRRKCNSAMLLLRKFTWMEGPLVSLIFGYNSQTQWATSFLLFTFFLCFRTIFQYGSFKTKWMCNLLTIVVKFSVLLAKCFILSSCPSKLYCGQNRSLFSCWTDFIYLPSGLFLLWPSQAPKWLWVYTTRCITKFYHDSAFLWGTFLLCSSIVPLSVILLLLFFFFRMKLVRKNGEGCWLGSTLCLFYIILSSILGMYSKSTFLST